MTTFAFPETARMGGDRGMTLRDYFAAKAFPVLWEATFNMPLDQAVDADFNTYTVAARGSYLMADAMLKARDA